MAKIVQTAGRNALGEFAPEFAHFNDDVLFGENWNNNDIDVKTRSIITVVALMAQGITDSSLKFHLQNAKDHGVSQKEIAAVITHVGFYAGWPKAWAVFNLAKEVWNVNEGDLPYEDESMRAHAKSMVFPIGQPNDAFAPNGKIVPDDINKKAASIELYLPDSIIKTGGNYYPIEWESRKRIRNKNNVEEALYQGVISYKDDIKHKFHEMRNKIERGDEVFKTEEWKNMKKLLETIVFAFNNEQ